MSVDGGPDRVILDVSAPGEIVAYPKWSKNGKMIYAHINRGATRLGGVLANGPLSRIVAVPITGGPPRTVLAEDPSRPFSRGQFATDGRRVFFTSTAIASDVYLLELRPNPRR